MIGGMFGKEAQVILARRAPEMGAISITKQISNRQRLWESCKPWTRGLASLFDCSQEELIAQFTALSAARQAIDEILEGQSDLERIAYRHIISLRRRSPKRNLGKERWQSLLRELDAQQVPLTELSGRAKEVLRLVRQKKQKVDTWAECYNPNRFASTEDGKLRCLRREVTHFLHNCAKGVAGKVGQLHRT